MKVSKIKRTSPDKVNGKLVIYSIGDCLSLECENGTFIAAFVSEKFNKYYDLVLLEYNLSYPPTLETFITGRYFGTRFGSLEDIQYAVDKCMIECKYIDNNSKVNKVGKLNLIQNLKKISYAYYNTIEELLDYYQKDLPIRIEKTKNAEKFPEIGFVSKHLILVSNIIQPQLPPTAA